jgi:glycosyltransferase involved in cell wall biosynthesis
MKSQKFDSIMNPVTHPPVTVLMTVNNGGKYLKSSAESVLNQTFRDFEFLIISDCSTNDSVKMIESFNDERVIIYHNEKNMGQTKSLNVGLKLASRAPINLDDVIFRIFFAPPVMNTQYIPSEILKSNYV